MSLENKLKLLPDKPGVYQMKDDKGEIIYVGKARSLKNRVRSYFQSVKNHTAKTKAMVAHIVDLDYIIVDSEVEALILECNLIKKYRPRYNVNLKDDKNYPIIKVTINEPYPRVFMVRSINKDGAKYYGPFTSSGAVYETLKLLKKLFPLRTCKRSKMEQQDRPCLNYHIKQCLAPCMGNVDPAEYAKVVKDVCMVLEGRHEELIKRLRREMEEAAENLEFERAAQLRNQMLALERIQEKQKVVSSSMEDQDVFAMARGFDEVCIQVFFVRAGKIMGQEHYFLTGTDDLSRTEVMTAFVKQYYSKVEYVPREVILQEEIEDADVIEAWLRDRRGGKIEIKVPQRGEKLKLVEMVARNALMVLEQHNENMQKEKAMTEGAMLELQQYLGLDEPPLRIECYDISNTQGTESVGSMVVFVNGRPSNQDYRRFKIKTVEGPNDFASMNEVITRRFARARKEMDEINAQLASAEGAGLDSGSISVIKPNFAVLPDLVIIDGGKGQLSSARAAMNQLGFSFVSTYGLAKEFEHLFREGSSEPIILPRNSKALYLIQRIRDEAHRFAITYHRKLRSQRNLKSILEEIPGIGSKRKQSLLKYFGSLQKIKQASVEELTDAPGMNLKVAQEVYEFFQSQ